MSPGPELARYRTEGEGQGRFYTHPASGVQVPSVTSVLKLSNKDALIQWAANLTLRWAHENRDMVLNRDLPDFMGAGKYQWTKFRDERASVGTEIHEYVEADLGDAWDMPQPWDPEVLQMVEQWRKFRAEHEVIPWYLETTVWSHKHGYAGTLDGWGTIDGIPTLWDLKSSKSLWPEHEMQLAALAKADVMMQKQPDGTWIELPLPEVEKFGFIHIRPRYLDPLKRVDEPAFCELHWLDPDDVEDRFAAFCGFLSAWKAEQSLKQRRKEREK